MEPFFSVFIMLGMVLLSSLLYRLLPQISLPLYQIGLGMVLGYFPIASAFHLEPEMFMLLFIAPLLFIDSKQVQNRDLWRYKTPILLLALGLVFSTTLVVGPFISWLVPGLPLAAAFALAAILSPTDAVAVKAMSGKINMPHSTKTIIEGESLLNDASGLMAFRFALAAQFTGIFSLRLAGFQFVTLTLGGVFVGVALVWVITHFTKALRGLGVNNASIFVLTQIATPFAVFLTAEHLGFSGVIAVVSAGIYASVKRALIFTVHEAHIRFAADGTWSTLLYALNGLVFVLLGIQLTVIASSRQLADAGMTRDLASVLVIYAAIVIIRFVWVLVLHGGGCGGRFKNALLISLSGVKGAVTLAACFSIPAVVTLSSGAQVPFPERETMLFISGGVILVSVLVASVLLPLIFPREAGNNDALARDTRKRLIQIALKQVADDTTQSNRQAAGFLQTYYECLMSERSDLPVVGDIRRIRFSEMGLFKKGLQAERDELERLLKAEKNNEFGRFAILKVMRANEFKMKRLERRGFLKESYLQLREIYNRAGDVSYDELARVKMHTTEVSVKALNDLELSPKEKKSRLAVVAHFRYKLDTFLSIYECETAKKYQQAVRGLIYRARLAEKTFLTNLHRIGEIDNATRVCLMLDIEMEEVAELEEEVAPEGS